eukprot:scaffold9062_cov154-Amphora_coffeaeformis.AAC.5
MHFSRRPVGERQTSPPLQKSSKCKTRPRKDSTVLGADDDRMSVSQLQMRHARVELAEKR